MVRHFVLTVAFSSVTLLPLLAQGPSKSPPDFTGAWDQYRGGRGANADPKLTPPAAGSLVLKPEYLKPYEERRALEAAATQRGEALATAGAQCVPYGMPTMMAVATYPIEILQTANQVTIITDGPLPSGSPDPSADPFDLPAPPSYVYSSGEVLWIVSADEPQLSQLFQLLP